MKKNIKKNFIFLFVIIVYLLRATEYEKLDYIYIAAFFTSILSLYIIKNKWASVIIGSVILISVSVYHLEFSIYAFPVFILTLIYKSIIRKHENLTNKAKGKYDIEDVLLQLLFFAGIALLIYYFISVANDKFNVNFYNLQKIYFLTLVLFLVWVLGKVSGKSKVKDLKNSDIEKNILRILNRINFTALCLFIVTEVYSFSKIYNTQLNSDIVSFPWIVWLCVLLYENNPLIYRIIYLAESRLNKTIQKGRIK